MALEAQENNKAMNLIIPMAGRGTRLRPQTLTTMKPLIEIAGKTIVQRILDVVIKQSKKQIKNIGFIIEKPNEAIEKDLFELAKKNNIKPHVFFQHKAKGTAHAIYCAKSILKGPVLIVFADTLFETDLVFPENTDGCIFVQEVDDPSSYGVVKVGKQGYITDFIEKPKNRISNLAIVGIYYFKDGSVLAQEIKRVIDNNIILKGEYQITTVLENLKNKKALFTPHKIKKWHDFGTPKNLLNSHAEILKQDSHKIHQIANTTIIPPCYIAKDVIITDSKIGPFVSIGSGTKIQRSTISNTIIQKNTIINEASLDSSIIGNNVEYNGGFQEVNIGDYSTFR